MKWLKDLNLILRYGIIKIINFKQLLFFSKNFIEDTGAS